MVENVVLPQVNYLFLMVIICVKSVLKSLPCWADVLPNTTFTFSLNNNYSNNNTFGDFDMNGISNIKHKCSSNYCCRDKNKCSLNGNWKTSNIIGMSKGESGVRCYISSTGQTFKNGFYAYDIH